MAGESKIKDNDITRAKKNQQQQKKTSKKVAVKENQNAQNETSRRIRNDIAAIVLIAMGLFLAIGLFTMSATGELGKALSYALLGIMGVMGYAFPFLLMIVGAYMLIAYRKRMGRKQIVISAIIVFLVITLIHSITDNNVNSSVRLFEYYGDAFKQGVEVGAVRGGGILGALLAYPLLLLVGNVGAIMFLSVGILILLILLTGKTISSSVETALDKTKERKLTQPKAERLSDEDIEDEDAFFARQDRIIRPKHYDDDLPKPKKKKSKLILPLFHANDDDNDDNDEDGFFDDKAGIVKPVTVKADEIKPFSEVAVKSANNQTAVYDDGVVRKRTEAPTITVEPLSNVEESIPVSNLSKEEAPVGYNAKGVAADPANTSPIVQTIPPAAIEYQRPPLTLLKQPEPTYVIQGESPEEKGRLLIRTLESFGIGAKIVNIAIGPAITRFEIQPAQGVRVNRITSLSNDIALALAAPRVRIEAPIPGKAAVGIEIPNSNVAAVYLRDIIESRDFKAHKSPIAFALGKDIAGAPLIGDLDKMPHMLIAGTTGSGKSVCVNDIIISMIYKSSPDDLRLILIDPKVVELSVFGVLPHLLMPVVTDPKRASMALKWAAHEMDNRYELMAKVGARERSRYNALMENPEDRLPKMVIIIDELADLMMVAQKDVEESICRIAQLGRAAGIHLIVATQSPRVDIITGLIKANIPSRIAFMVSNGTDSRVILDMVGAEKLLGKGDMLFHPNGANKPVRAQGAFVSDEEVEAIAEFFAQNSPAAKQDTASFDAMFTSKADGSEMRGNGKEEDELLPRALWVCLETGVASTSLLQRKLRVGYARASRLIDIMEEKKYISGFEGSKPRKLLVSVEEYRAIYGGNEATTGEFNIDGLEE